MPKQVFGLKEPTEHLTFAEYPTKKFPRLLGQFEEWANSARDQSLSLNELKSVVTKYYEIVEIEYSTRDCFESKGEYMRVLNIGLSLLDLCKADLLDVDHKVFDYANSKLLSRLKVWTSSLVNKVVPRPSNLGQYSQFVELLNHYHEWISSIPLQNGFPDADVLTLNGFGYSLFIYIGS